MIHIPRNIKQSIGNLFGWRTSRHIVVFESDDWGSIRMPSKTTYDSLLSKGLPVDRDIYFKFDSLESETDYINLFDVLHSIKDSKYNSPIFTLNYVSTNPDFERIKECDFNEYFYEDISRTYERFPECQNNIQIIRQGIKERLIIPQSHGREHLNVVRWLYDLQNRIPLALLAFENQMFSLPMLVGNEIKSTYVDALFYSKESDRSAILGIVSESLRMFREQWDYTSRSFMAPGYIWDSHIETVLFSHGVDYLQGVIIQLEPSLNAEKRFTKKYHFTGQRNEFKQVYLVRNSFFEPSENQGKDWVSNSLRGIANSFLFGKPAIIQSHRVNYSGTINSSNRDKNLQQLKRLLHEIVKNWPDVEFMSTVQLGDLMRETLPS
jgi:hypothetical protein